MISQRKLLLSSKKNKKTRFCAKNNCSYFGENKVDIEKKNHLVNTDEHR